MLTLDSFNSHWKLFSENRSLVVALSGGIDSVVLLHLLVSLKQRGSDFSLRAIHINHQLCNASEEWAQFCADLCVSWDVPYDTYSVSINQNSG